MIRAEELAQITWRYYCIKYKKTIEDIDSYIQSLAAEGLCHTGYVFSDSQEAGFIFKYCEKLGYKCSITKNLDTLLSEVKISWEHLL